jgi:hypothetical protein
MDFLLFPMETEKKYFFNGSKIRDIQLLTVVPEISDQSEYTKLKSQLENYILDSKENKFCLDLSKIKKANIGIQLSVMMNFHRVCQIRDKENYLIPHLEMENYLDKPTMISLFSNRVYDSTLSLDNFLSK